MGKDHIDHDTQAIICGEHPHRRGESSRPVLLHVGAVEAEEDPLPGGSGAGGVGTRLGSPHCTSHAQGGGRPDARLHLARLWGRRTGMARGGRGRRWSPRQSVFYQGPFIRREKGRRKSTEDTALAAQSIGRVAPANKLSDKDRNGFPRQRRRQGRCVPKTHRKVEGLQAGETGSRGRWIFLSREYILYVVVTEQWFLKTRIPGLGRSHGKLEGSRSCRASYETSHYELM